MNKEKNFVSAVIYIHNSEKRIGEFLGAIVNVLEENFEHSEIVCVNDYSSDNSLNVIKECSKETTSTSISVVNMSYFHGVEVAMSAGVDLAIGDFVFEFDSCILDFNPDDVMKVYYKSLEGFDVVSAVPNKREKMTSKLFYKIFSRFSNQSTVMHTERFRILSRRVINRVADMNKATPYRKVIYAKQGLKVASLRYDVVARVTEKQDKIEKRYRSGLAMDSLILFTNFGYRFSIGMTILMIIMMVAVLIYTVVAYIVSQPVEGWTSTILFLSIAFLGVFAIFAVIIKYLEILLNLVFKRKHYSFESIEKLTK